MKIKPVVREIVTINGKKHKLFLPKVLYIFSYDQMHTTFDGYSLEAILKNSEIPRDILNFILSNFSKFNWEKYQKIPVSKQFFQSVTNDIQKELNRLFSIHGIEQIKLENEFNQEKGLVICRMVFDEVSA